MSSSFDPNLGDSLPDSLIPSEEWYEVYLRYGLYVGAAFQLACILAVILLPETKDQDGKELEEDSSSSDDDDGASGSSHHLNASSSHRQQQQQNRGRKADKRKKRQ